MFLAFVTDYLPMPLAREGATVSHPWPPIAAARFTWEACPCCWRARHGTEHKPGCSAALGACRATELPHRSLQERLTQGHLRGSINSELEGRETGGDRGGYPEQQGMGKQAALQEESPGCSEWASTCQIRRQTNGQDKKGARQALPKEGLS